MPSSGGDIFIHAKSDEISMLFELCQEVMSRLPADSVDKFEDIYSFVYKNGRDLSGFIDGMYLCLYFLNSPTLYVDMFVHLCY